ncbi:MAG: hypothetical protein ISR66_18955 [Desulfobacula sp.]|nr:hypothetical protein [Desulfobacula sp.]
MFYNKMEPYYQGGKKSGVEWHGGRYVYSADRAKKEMTFLADQCMQRNIPLVNCKETVLVDYLMSITLSGAEQGEMWIFLLLIFNWIL